MCRVGGRMCRVGGEWEPRAGHGRPIGVSEKLSVTLKSLALTAVALLGVLVVAVAYLLGASGASGASGGDNGDGVVATVEQARPVTGIRMTGRGEVSAVPDELSFGLTVTARRLALDEALADSSATMKRVLAELEQYGVERADVQTTGLSMSPEYEYHSYGPPTLTGYRVTQQARVTVSDLGQGGKAITAAVEVGGNGVRVHSIRLEVGDPEAALAQARDAAIADATDKAGQYAEATGQSLGAVLSVKEVSAPAPAPQPVYLRDMRAAQLSADAAVPIRAGRSELTVRVEVVWSFG